MNLFVSTGGGVYGSRLWSRSTPFTIPSTVMAGDMNRDGTPDVVAAGAITGNPLQTWVMRADNGASLFETRWSPPAGVVARLLIDNDDDLDLGVVTRDVFLLATNDGTGQLEALFDEPAACAIHDGAAADFNRDGAVDAVSVTDCGVFIILSNP